MDGFSMTTTSVSHGETDVNEAKGFVAGIDARLLVSALALFAVCVALFTYVQFGTLGLAGNDGYYHIKMGLLIREQGLKPEFPWLPLSILNEEAFYDHHLLYHAYLALFARVDPAVDGGHSLTLSAKIASIILPSLAFLAIWWLLRARQVHWAGFWMLALFAVSEAFLYRMSMPRAQAASLLVLVLGLHWLLQRRYWLLLPLGFAYVWLYNAFPLLLMVAGIYVAVTLLMDRRFDWQALAYPLVGIGLGLVINPYFPQNISFVISHLLPKIGDSATRVGNEWYPYETWTLVENSGFALVAFLLGVMALGWREERMDRATLIAFILAVLFGAMLFKSRRFVEYFPAFALVFAALSVSPLWGEWRRRRSRLGRGQPLAMLILLALPLATTMLGARDALGRSKPADQYAQASLWLRSHVPRGEMIFQTDWDDFTRLFFYHDDAIYTAGLDPTYMELYDQSLYDRWVDITRGRVNTPGKEIQERFGANYIFSDLKHAKFIDQAKADATIKEIYRDNYAVIFAITG